MESNRSYRIRTEVGKDETYRIDVSLTQTYDMFEILSLKLKQNNQYKFYDADYGVLVGRVLANQGFGIPNAKISIFIEVDSNETNDRKILYNFTSTRDTNYNGVRYNLLPDFVDNACHQDVGTFPNKRLVLDNQDVLEVFEKYYKYTTITNNSGDFMLYGVPTGMQNLHVDIDLSDIGVLSQRPRDMVYKGYNINQFESPNKFKQSTNLNSLSQIYTQDKGVYVYPYWGNSNNGEETVGITRCDINIDYTFEPTAIFIGSVITDKASNSINQKCTANKNAGRMSELIGGEGDIEMIRKTVDGKVEEFSIKGNRLIDSDGVWCYQVPMNLDYISTNEFGETVPTDNPSKGIPTRARVRFRIKMDNTIDDNATATNRCMYLIPNNPKLNDDFPIFSKTLEPDYEFGSATNDESYKDLFWNCVYTVKNYIPKLQKNNKQNNRQHTGIKWINHGDNVNQMPYNSLTIKLGFMYRLICILTKVIINLIAFINQLVSLFGGIIGLVEAVAMAPVNAISTIKIPLGFTTIHIGSLLMSPLKWLLKNTIFWVLDLLVPTCISLDSNFCDDSVNKITYYPGCGKLLFTGASLPGWLGMDKVWNKTRTKHSKDEEEERKNDPTLVTSYPSNSNAMLYNCVENQLAQDNDVTSFNFCNDWVNGTLYLPLWYRKITKKKKFLFITLRKPKDQWCSAENYYPDLRILQTCSVSSGSSENETYINFNNQSANAYVNTNDDCGKKCHDKTNEVKGLNGVIQSKSVLSNTKTAYYYKSVEVINNEVKMFFATDIVLLGSLNDCDTNGIPQFFKKLPSTTYVLPNDILFTDNDVEVNLDNEGNISYSIDTESVETGCDWGNLGGDQCPRTTDGGLFYGIGCSTIEMKAKSCINLRRICEIGVSKDVISEVGVNEDKILAPDGYISYDELYDADARAMFATMNGNNLRTKMDTKTGYKKYDFFYLYPNNFDGSMYKIMENNQSNCNKSYKLNYEMENFNADYYQFRMGQENRFYIDNDGSKSFPVFDNSFYFYFGIKSGNTAIDKFNAQFFAPCESVSDVEDTITIIPYANTWCALSLTEDAYDSYITLDLGSLSLPCDIEINSVENVDSISLTIATDEKIYVGKKQNEDGIFEGYAYKGGVKGEIGLKNGTYNISITDSDGNLTISTFELKTPYLTYRYNVVNFNISNDEIDKNYGGNANKDFNCDNIEKRMEIGGYIEITDIQQNKKPLSPDEYDIVAVSKETILVPKKCDKIIFVPYGDYDYNIIVKQKCNGQLNELNSVEQIVTVKQKQPVKLYINDIDYDLISNFNNEKWVTLSEKSNYNWEYYDNVDYYVKQISEVINQYTTEDVKDLKNNIKKNLKETEYIVYDENGKRIECLEQYIDQIFGISKAKVTAISKLLKIEFTDEIKGNIYEIINNTKTVINEEEINIITIDDKVTAISKLLKIEFTDEIKGNIYEIINNTKTVINEEEIEDIWKKWDNERDNVIKTMKSNFSIVCEDAPSEIILRVVNNDKVIEYGIKGQNEEVETIEIDDIETKEIHILTDKETTENYLTTSNEISNILIPTITSKDTEDSKRFYVSGKNIDFKVEGKDKYYYLAYDYQNDYGSKFTKTPYKITVKETGGNTICNDFNIHFLDKIFNVNMMTWAYMYNIPFYTNDENKRGKIINLPGFVTAEIFNGTPTEIKNYDESKDYSEIKFDTQAISNFVAKIITINSEDAIPTKRYIVEDIISKIKYLSNIININDNDVINFYIKWFEKDEDIIFKIINYYDEISNILNNETIEDKVTEISKVLDIDFTDETKSSINNILNGDAIITDKALSIIKTIVNNGEIVDDFNKIILSHIKGENDIKELGKLMESIGGIINNGFYKNYQYNQDSPLNSLSITTPNPSCFLSLQTTDGCFYNDNISSLMSIVLDESSIEDGDNSKLIFNLKNGNSDSYSYYIYKINGNDYPLNNAELIPSIKNETILPICTWDASKYDLFNVNKEWGEDNRLKFFETEETTIDTTKDEYYLNVNDNKKFYIVVVSSDNNRCISPVFDFTKTEISNIIRIETINKNNSTIKSIDYVFNFNTYYLNKNNNYSYKIKILFNENIIYNSEDNTDKIEDYLTPNIVFPNFATINGEVVIEVVDIVGLKHKLVVKDLTVKKEKIEIDDETEKNTFK